MQRERLALFTVVYPAALSWVREWWRSVEEQTDRPADVCIALDGVSPAQVRDAAGADVGARWLPASPGEGPASIRSRVLRRLADEYDGVVCVDCDDVLMPTRVEAARRMLVHADLSACALELVDENNRLLGTTLAPPPGRDAATMLARTNTFGLSNSTFRADLLRRTLPLPADCILADWLLATRAWGLGAVLAFDAQPHMRYRQHQGNVARMVPPFTAGELRRATQLVLDHYRHALTGAHAIPAPAHSRLADRMARVGAFLSAITSDPTLATRYLSALDRLEPERVWWWHVAHPALEAMWTN